MVTFCVICIVLAIVAAVALGIVTILGTILSGAALIVLDIIVGLSPFILAIWLLCWLFKKRE